MVYIALFNERTEDNMQRKKKVGGSLIIAVMAIMILVYSPGLQAAETGGLTFKDIAATDADLAYIKYLASQDIIKGYPDGSFQPQTGLTRAQAAVVMVKAGKINLDPNAVSPFKDLKKDHWARAYIAAAVKAGYISGYPDGTFKPDQPLSRAQGISLLLKLSQQPQNAVLPALKDINAQHWAAKAVAVGLASGMVGLNADKQNYYPDGPFTRINMAHALGILLTEDPNLSASSLPGQLKAVAGKTTVIKAGSSSEEELKTTATVNAGDTIITAKGASAELSYPDGSSMLIKEDSKVSVKEAKGRKYIKTNGQEGIAIDWLNLDMKQGTMFTALATKHETSESTNPTEKKTSHLNNYMASLNGVERIAAAAAGSTPEAPWYEASKNKKVKVKVDMPWGVAAVRGTFVMISVSPSGQASVSCLTGNAEVTNGGQTVPLGQNQSTQVTTENAPPPAPAPLPPATVQLFDQVKTWIEETAKTMDQNQEQAAPPPPPALIAALKEVLAPVQQTPAEVQQTTQTNPAPNNAMTALQAINQALGNIGISVGNNAIAFQAPTTPSTNTNSPGNSGGPSTVATTDYNTPGTYGPAATESRPTLNGNVNINSSGITLQNTIIAGSLTLAAGIGEGSVTLKNVKVQGNTNILGGGPDSIHVEDCELYTVTVDKRTNTVRIVAKGTSTIGTLTLNSGAKLEESGLTGIGFSSITTGASIPAGATIILDGNFAAVNIDVPGLSIQVAGGSIERMNIAATATGSALVLASGASVGSLQVNAAVNISGEGQIQSASINADGVKMSRMPVNISFSGIGSAVVAGQSLDASLVGGSSGSLAGRVLDASGNGVVGAMILIHMVNETEPSPIHTTTANGGGFLLSGITPGSYIMGVMPASESGVAQMPTTLSDLTVTAGQIKIVPDITLINAPPIPSVPQLSGLSLSDMDGHSIALSPAFTSNIITYTTSVDNGVTGITVIPTAAVSGSTIKVNTTSVISGAASGAISLQVGVNVISIEVTGPDAGPPLIYTITVMVASPPWMPIGKFVDTGVKDLSLTVANAGTPYIIYKNGNNNIYSQKYDRNPICPASWTNLGSVATAAGNGLGIKVDGTDPYVAYNDNTKVRVMKKVYGGGLQGDGINATSVNDLSLLYNDAPYMAVGSADGAAVYRVNSSTWVQEGLFATTSAVNKVDWCMDAGDKYLVYCTAAGEVEISIYKNAWSSTTVYDAPDDPATDVSVYVEGGIPYIAFVHGNQIEVKKYADATWSSLGTFTGSACKIGVLPGTAPVPILAYIDGNGTASIQKYADDGWIGGPLYSLGAAGSPGSSLDSCLDLAIDKTMGIPYVAFSEGSPSSQVWVMTPGIKVSAITVTGVGNATTVIKSNDLQMQATCAPADATNQTIAWSVENGTGSATIDPATGRLTAGECGTVTVKATARDGSGVTATQEITVTILAGSDAKAITAFSIESYTGIIDETNHSISVIVPDHSALNALIANFTNSSGSVVSVNGTVQTSGSTINSFYSPLVYKVTAENGTSVSYTVTVIIATQVTEIAAISGTAQVGEELTAGALTPAGATANYQWQNGIEDIYTNIAGATSSTYRLVPGDVDKAIRVVATGKGSYSGTVTSAATAPVAPAVISIAAIPGVTPPVTGATPVDSIEETDEYTGSVTWAPLDTSFAASTDYTATITIDPKAGYTLTGVAANYFTVAGAGATNEADLGVVTAVFPKTGLDKVTGPQTPGNKIGWDGDTIYWNNVDNNSGYYVRVYKDGSIKETHDDIPAGATNYSIASDISIYGGGSYTVTVQAKGDGINYSDGPVSDISDPNVLVVIATISGISPSQIDPSVVVTLTGANFNADETAEYLANWTIDVGETNLAVDTITWDSDTQTTIQFTGTATSGYGIISIQVLAAAISGDVDSNSINVVVGTP